MRPVLYNVRVIVGYIGVCEKGDGIDSFEVCGEGDEVKCSMLRRTGD